MTEETLFHEALAKSPAERAAFLAQACAGQPELRHAVEALLAAHGGSASLLDQPAADPNLTGAYAPPPQRVTGVHVPQDAQPGYVIAGRYILEQRIGEGGMGEVWVAKQTEPVKRKVALKLVKAGMDSKAVLQRFEAERQALALMDHPHIAKVLDGGLTEDRHPFFVMELVHGLSLNKFCDEAKLTPKQRLELFVPICQAVQHAHQKGIIHRDLKPGNILVTLIDGKPVPKVIDFGVAKATAGKLTDESLSTHFGAVVGTLEYMAPEQAGYAGEDIDTRADIYSLGVILYEMLTGLRPLDSKRLKQAALTEMIRIIKEEEPSKPSTRLSTDESLPSLAALRQTEPKKLMAMLRGELDWVVMKCLEKQRDRRYETANGLARDIQRYLADEPVEARPPSFGYRAGKFLRRNKGPVIAASLVLLALLAGMVGTAWQAIQAEQARADEATQRTTAEANERKALAAAEKERQARLEEERQRKFAEAISRFVQEDFLALTSVEGQDRFGGAGKEKLSKDTTVRELLDRAAAKLRARKDLDPRIEAELCWIVGVNYRGAGDAQKALEFLKRSVERRSALFGRAHASTLDAMNSLGLAYSAAGQTDLAVSLLEETVKLEKVTLGPSHRGTLAAMHNLALAYQNGGRRDLALPLYEETLKLQKATFSLDHPDTLTTMDCLALAYQQAGKRDLALPLFEEALKRARAKCGPNHPVTLGCMHHLAMAYQQNGKVDLALPLYEETLQRAKATLGADHPDTLASMSNLAGAYADAWKHDLALALFEEALKLVRAKLGPDHPSTLTTMNNLAVAYQKAGMQNLARPLLEEALKLRKTTLSLDHPDTLSTMNNLAWAYQQTGNRDLALPLYEETLKLQKAKLGPDHPEILRTMHNLAGAYKEAGKPDLALPLYEETLTRSKAKLGPDHPRTLTTMSKLASTYYETGKRELGLALHAETFQRAQATLGSDHPDTLASMHNLAVAYWQTKQLDKSIPLFETAVKLREKNHGRDHLETLRVVANLGVNYKDAGRLQEAIPLLEEAHRASKKHPTLRWVGTALLDAYAKAGENAKLADLLQEQLTEARQALPKDSPQLAGMLAQIGSGMLEQKKWTEAEPLLRECLAIREKKQPDVWQTFNTKSMLGGALLGQKKHADAEPLLLAGYEGMKQREKSIPPLGQIRIPEALDRLIGLYTATNKPDEVKKWQAERAKYPATVPQPAEKK